MQADKLSIPIVTILGGAAVAVAFFVRGELLTHRIAETAHPIITSQLGDIRTAQVSILADLKKAEIMRVDVLICEDSANQFYRDHIATLIAEWETLTERTFPRDILRCV